MISCARNGVALLHHRCRDDLIDGVFFEGNGGGIFVDLNAASLPQRQQCDASNVLNGCSQPEIGGSAGARRLEQRNFGAVRGDSRR